MTESHSESHPSILHRISLAFVAFFSILFSGATALRFSRIRSAPTDISEPEPANSEASAKPAVAALREIPSESAVQLLSILQREGRFIDFLQEDIGAYSDQEIGAAARVVHQGCKKALDENFVLAPARDEAEGAEIVVEAGFDSDRIRLTGNLVGDPPFHGTLQHRGWQVTSVRLPKVAKEHNTSIIAPAEIEI